MKKTLLQAANKAGSILLDNFGKIKSIYTKKGNSYYTNVDLAAEKAIISTIREKYPDHSILSEEKGSLRTRSEYEWIIDPLDGTHNYINRLPLFGTSIALAHQGEVIMSAIYLPIFKEMYVAEKGKGSYCNGKRIHVSETKDAKKAFLVTDLTLRYHPEWRLQILKMLRNEVYDLRALGCAVISHAYVSRGSADGMFTTQMFPWDIAGGGLLIEEAGGKVTDFQGRRWKPVKGAFISSNKKIHSQLLRILE